MDYVVLRKALSAVRDLPTLPSVVARVNQLINDPKTDTGRIASVISSDQSIATKVLKVINSAYYGNQKTHDIHKAISRLGFRTVSQLITNVSICNMFQEDGNSRFDRNEFWRHSIAVAVISKMIAGKTKQLPEEAFTCGLLHDIGKVVLDQYLHPEMVKVLSHAVSHKSTFYDAEKSTIKIDHTTIGEMAAKKWLLPHLVTVSIKFHHSDLRARKGVPGSDNLMVDVVRLADYLARDMKLGENGDACGAEWSDSLMERLELGAEVVDGIRNDCLEEIDRCAGFIDLPRRQPS